jgi:hypothetical protein
MAKPEKIESECWEWAGTRFSYGYGRVGQSGAHRIMWASSNGRPVPEGMCVRHTCDNPPCVNPAHLVLGTHAENMADKVRRGRSAQAETHGRAKLCWEDVEAMRIIREARGVYYYKLAEAFGVSVRAAFLACNRKTWRGQQWQNQSALII